MPRDLYYIGLGVRKDKVLACVLYDLSPDGSPPRYGIMARRKRDLLSKAMTRAELRQGERLVQAMRPDSAKALDRNLRATHAPSGENPLRTKDALNKRPCGRTAALRGESSAESAPGFRD